MSVLDNSKHEKYAQLLASGETADAAYQGAGFSANRANAIRLKSSQNVQDRVRELQEETAKKLGISRVFEAKTMFEELLQDIKDAKAAGDHRTAAELRKFMIRCFGYEDSPTLTHEHVNGKPIPETKHRDEVDDPSPDQSGNSGLRSFSDALRKFRNRTE